MAETRRLTSDQGGHAVSALTEELTGCLEAFEREMLAGVHSNDRAGILLSALSSVLVRTALVVNPSPASKAAFLERVSNDWELFRGG